MTIQNIICIAIVAIFAIYAIAVNYEVQRITTQCTQLIHACELDRCDLSGENVLKPTYPDVLKPSYE